MPSCRWAGKEDWVKAKKAERLWKDVRAYDASDLEQWLEQSLPAQVWFANERHLPSQEVRSLDKCWADWANVSTPPLTGTLFGLAIDATKLTVLSRLSESVERPILITADSTEEALAFLAQLFSERGGDELATYRDRVLVFDKPGVLPRLAASVQTFIPVAYNRDVEREMASCAKSMHSILIYPRNGVTTKPDIILEHAHEEIFTKALEEMGKDRDEISRLAAESGRSVTVLRRRLSTIPAVKTPEWAEDHRIARSLIPFLFAGTWNSRNETDKIGLSLLAGDRPYDELEKDYQSILQLNDTPLWSAGPYRGAISKIDLLFAIGGVLTREDLDHYFSIARMVLGEDNPALDLAEDQRWAAAIHGKTREFSEALRSGISETLVLLAVYGGDLFKERLDIDTEIEAVCVVRELLPIPLTSRILDANDRDLPTYAEAAPDAFLSILEQDLRSSEPAVLDLLRPAKAGLLGTPSRTGLLWALEGLSWNPETLPRAALILARLARVEIKDNWINKPTNSLESIFRAWMPQTAANHQQRVSLMKKLGEKFPNVAWKLCVAQFGNYHQVGNYSHKPRWRTDGYGFGEPSSTQKPIVDFVREMVEMALTWKDYSPDMLCDLVERVHDLTAADQGRVWALVESWAKTNANDADKAAMREKIRVATRSRRATMRRKRNGQDSSWATARETVYAALEPRDLLNTHAWLFREGWVEESADEVEVGEKVDHQKREARIEKLRTEALREILAERGLPGILQISERGKASWVIGRLVARIVLSKQELQELLRLALMPIFACKEDLHSYRDLIAGALRGLEDDTREAVLKGVAAGLSESNIVRLFILAPFCKSTWKLVDALGEAARIQYWSDVEPDWIRYSDAENNEAIERLLKAERPRAAFACARFEPDKLDVQVLFRLLSAIAEGGNEQADHYRLESHDVQKAFQHLNISLGLTLEQKAGLELAYLEALAPPWNRRNNQGIPNLERYVEAHPELFVRAIVWTYKRKDRATDPIPFQVPPDRLNAMADRGHRLLEAIERIPGHDEFEKLAAGRLANWIETVRKSCADLSRLQAADHWIGQLLSCAPVGTDGVWPCEPVREVMEEIQSADIMNGAHTGAFNSRGAVWHGEGGEQERELAEKYRSWGQALQISHPFIASHLLMTLAKTYDQLASSHDTDASIRRRNPMFF